MTEAIPLDYLSEVRRQYLKSWDILQLNVWKGKATMVPLRDENPTVITPYVTYGLIIANILAFVYELSLPPQQLQSFFHIAAVVPRELSASFAGMSINQPLPEWTTLITSQFLHAGFAHLIGNMLFLWIFGNNVEEALGHVKFLIFYLTCGVLAGLAQWFFAMQSGIPSLGASGAIAGVLGAYILKYPNARILTFFGYFLFYVPAFFFLGLWFVQQAFYGIASLQAPANVGMESGGIAYWAHAGGFVFGAILAPILGLFANQSRNQSNFEQF